MRRRRRSRDWSTDIAREVQIVEQRNMLSATVAEHSGVAYFLSETASQVDRYDLDAEEWLSPVVVTEGVGLPTALHVDADGLYVAFDRSVYRYGLDGGNETHLFNAEQSANGITSDGNLIIVNLPGDRESQDTLFVDKSTNQLLNVDNPWYSYRSLHGWSISRETNRMFARSFGVSPSDIHFREYNESGEIVASGESRYHGDYPGASQTWVFSEGSKVVDDSGTVYSTDSLTYIGTLNGRFEDVNFLDGEIPIVLRDNTVSAYSKALLPTGSATVGIDGDEIFLNSTNIIVFEYTDNGWTTELVPLDSLSPPSPGDPVDPEGLEFTPDAVYLTNRETVLLFSKSHQSLFEWDLQRQTYMNSIPLIGTPEFMTYSASQDTAFLAYQNGLIRKIDMRDGEFAEEPFAALPQNPLGLDMAGPYLFAVDPSGAWVSHYTFSPEGELIESVDWNYRSSEYVWSDVNQKLYFFRDDTSPNDLLWEEINADGQRYENEPAGGIGAKKDSPLHSSQGMRHPIHVSPNGNLVLLGSGVFHDASSLERLTTSLANAITDADWLGDTLYTITNSSYQRWEGTSYQLAESVSFSGSGHTLKRFADDRLLSINISSSGVPLLSIINSDLDVISPPSHELTVSGLSQVYESGEAQSVTIQRSGPVSESLAVSLSTSDSTVVAVPASVTIPAGESSVQVNVTPRDNQLANGLQRAQIRASAGDHADGLLRLQVLDNEVKVTHTDGSTIAGEDGTADLLGLSLNGVPTSDVVVQVRGDELIGNHTFVFNATNWDQLQYVPVAVEDNDLADGHRTSELLLSVNAATTDPVFSSSADLVVPITVMDDEPPRPHITGPSGKISDTQPVLSWTAVEGVQEYDIWLERVGDDGDPGRFTTSETSFSGWDGGKLAFGHYRVWVRALFQNQPASPWGAGDFFVAPSPEIFDLSSQRNDALPTFAWAPIEGAAHYEIWVANQTMGGGVSIHHNDLTEPVFQVEQPMQLGVHKVWVRAIGADGSKGRWSAAAEHYVGSVPNEYQKPTLANRPKFSWSQVSGAASYSVWISGPGGVIQATNISGTEFTPTETLANGRYRWWVIPTAVNGQQGRWSDVAEVYVGGGQLEFAVDSPAADSTPLIAWSDVENAASYRFHLYSVTEQKVIVDRADLSHSQVVAPFLLDGQYKAWVQASDEGGSKGSWSQPFTFRIDASNSSTEAVPVDGLVSTLEDQITFRWAADSDAASFEIYATDGEQIIELTDLSTSSHTIEYADRGILKWRVRAVTASGTVGPWSAEAIVDTTGRVKILSTPGTTNTSQPTIFWKNTLGAERYSVFVRDMSSGETVLRREDVVDSTFQLGPLSDGTYRIWIQAIGAGSLRGTWSLPLELTIQQN